VTGWADTDVAALRAGNSFGDNKIDTLVPRKALLERVVRW